MAWLLSVGAKVAANAFVGFLVQVDVVASWCPWRVLHLPEHCVGLLLGLIERVRRRSAANTRQVLYALVDHRVVADKASSAAHHPLLGVVRISRRVQHLHVVERLLGLVRLVGGAVQGGPLDAQIDLIARIELSHAGLELVTLSHVHAAVIDL